VKPGQLGGAWRWFFLAAALEAGAALYMLARVPREASGGVLFGFSAARLVMLALLLAFFALWTWCGIRLPPPRFTPEPRLGLILAAALISLLLALGLFLLRYLDAERLLPVYQRLSPLLFYLLALAVQSALWLLLLRNGFDTQAVQGRRPILIAALFAFCVLLFVLLFVIFTRLGLTPDPAYWGEPGVPLLGWQFGLALLAGGAVLLLGLRPGVDRDPRVAARTDIAMALALWALAALIWWSVPMGVMRTSFYAPITPPANIPLPNSDAAFYDYLAQSVPLGTAYVGGIPPRPLYILFLAGLHMLFGQNYTLILLAQTLLLAGLPAVLYLLAGRIQGRAAGVIVALFAIFRELTSLWISSEARVSNTRTLLTDLPTTLMLVLACLLVTRWLERKDPKSALLAGGACGLMLLLRTQSLLIIPLVALFSLAALWPQRRVWASQIAMFALAVLTPVLPWLAHNYQATGKLTFDDPRQLAVISSQYAQGGFLDLSQFDSPSESLAGNLLGFTFEHPGVVAGFVANHFLATEIGGLLALPLIEPYNGILAPVNLYWFSWDGRLAWYNLVLLILYLAFIALGLGAAWRRLRWAGLAPLAFNLGYALANGVGRFSGWRYDLPADWVAYFYFAIGVAEALASLALAFGAPENGLFRVPTSSTTGPFGHLRLRAAQVQVWRSAAPMLAGLALVGFLPWIAQVAFPPHFADLTPAALEERLATQAGVAQLEIDATQIHAFGSQPGAEILQGRLLYPRFYRRGLGVGQAHPSPAYAPRDFPRLGFLLLNEDITQSIFPSRDLITDIPQGADVILLGCRRDDYLEVRLIAVTDADLAYLSAPLEGPCSP